MDSSTRIENQGAGKSAEFVDIESQQATRSPRKSEIDPEAVVTGYLNLSATMASNDSLAIFRRFGDLNMLNLLCLQAELTNLRAEFLDIVSPSAENDPYLHGNFFKNKNPVDFTAFINGSSPERDIFEKIRAKLKEYNSSLLEAAQIKKIQTPDSDILSVFRHWLAARSGDSTLREPTSTSWDIKFSDDLVLLSGEAAVQSSMIHDILYKGQELLSSASGIFFSKREKEDDLSTTNIWEAVRDNDDKVNEQIAFANRMVMALFGGVALIVPVLIMAFHPTRNTCLITTTVATLLFALILAFEARDSRGKDVLTATAAYAAVLVVFLGTSLSGSPSTANTTSRA